MVKTMKVDVYKELCELYKEFSSEEPATLKQKLIRLRYLLTLRQAEKAKKHSKNYEEYGISIIQQLLNSTIAMNIYEVYENAMENQNLPEFDRSFDLMDMEYFRLKDELKNMRERKDVITKAEARSILRRYVDKVSEEDLLPYAKASVIEENIVAFPRR